MAFASNIGPAIDGSVAGMDAYLRMLQDQAQANELLANSNYIADQQRQPVAGLTLPTTGGPRLQPPPVGTPQINNTPVGVLPNTSLRAGVRMAGPAAGPGVNIAPPSGRNPTYQPGMTGRAGPPSAIPNELVPWQPAIPPSQGMMPVNGNQSPLQNGENSIINFITNAPTNLSRGVSNVAVRPIANTLQWLGSPTNRPTAQLTATGASVPPVAAPLSPPGGSSAGPAVAPLGSTAGPSIPQANGSGGGTSAGVAVTTQDSGDLIPREVRNDALKMPLSAHNYYQEQLLQQRQQITEDAQRQAAYFEAQKQQLAQVQQQKLNSLAADAASAQRTGNIGLMKKLQAQAEDILTQTVPALQAFDDKAQAVQENAIQLYRQNDQNLWQQQAVQAEAEWAQAGDPSRMIHILDAYGFPTQIEDAGGGKFYVIDITGQGTGRRRGANGGQKYTPQEIGDMFMSTISDAFRQQKAAEQAGMASKMFEHSLDLDKIDAQAAADIQKKMVELSLTPTDYIVQQDNNTGQTYIVPKDGGTSGKPMFVYNPTPAEIPNSGGLTEPNLKVVSLSGG